MYIYRLPRKISSHWHALYIIHFFEGRSKCSNHAQKRFYVLTLNWATFWNTLADCVVDAYLSTNLPTCRASHFIGIGLIVIILRNKRSVYYKCSDNVNLSTWKIAGTISCNWTVWGIDSSQLIATCITYAHTFIIYASLWFSLLYADVKQLYGAFHDQSIYVFVYLRILGILNCRVFISSRVVGSECINLRTRESVLSVYIKHARETPRILVWSVQSQAVWTRWTG